MIRYHANRRRAVLTETNDINHKSSTDRRARLVKQGRGGPPQILFRMDRWSVDIQAIRFVEELTLHEVALYVADLYRGAELNHHPPSMHGS